MPSSICRNGLSSCSEAIGQTRTAATFGADIAEMMKRQLTFAEAIAHPDTKLMAKQRLKLVRDDIFNQLSAAL